MALLPVADALDMLLDGVWAKAPERVPLHEAAGRLLAESVSALRTQPPFDASAMDGYAVRAADTEFPQRRLTVIGEAPAGRQFFGAMGSGEAVRIFTGAPVPAGADAILIQENAQIVGDGEIIAMEPVMRGRNIRRRGLDFFQGDLLLEEGRLLDPAALSLAAAANHPTVPVAGQPIVAIIATGDELVRPGSNPGPDQIISSNAYGVAAICRAAGAKVIDLGIARDTVDSIAELLDKALSLKADVVVTLGGASVGDHDLVNKVLTTAGMSLAFWKIAMRPGKPLMFGRLGTVRCVGLPGNPVASLLCSHLFLAPLVSQLAGRPHEYDVRYAELGAALPANDQRQDYIRARTEKNEEGTLVATPFPVQDSSMLRVLADSDCAIIRPPHAPAIDKGEACKVLMLR